MGHPYVLASSPGYHHFSPFVISCKLLNTSAEVPGMCSSTQQRATEAGLSSPNRGICERLGRVIRKKSLEAPGGEKDHREQCCSPTRVLQLHNQHCYHKASTPSLPHRACSLWLCRFVGQDLLLSGKCSLAMQGLYQEDGLLGKQLRAWSVVGAATLS